jgi:hypothetical protein
VGAHPLKLVCPYYLDQEGCLRPVLKWFLLTEITGTVVYCPKRVHFLVALLVRLTLSSFGDFALLNAFVFLACITLDRKGNETDIDDLSLQVNKTLKAGEGQTVFNPIFILIIAQVIDALPDSLINCFSKTASDSFFISSLFQQS